MLRRLLQAFVLVTLSLPVLAQELAWSGFGTLGYTRSNRDFAYQRFIDDGGSLARDSVFGLQADLRLNPQWSATLQLKAAPSLQHDSRWDLSPAWAFVAWRPHDDWLLRAGRLRVPLYLHSESMDVGVTHDMARLPAEMYLIAPNTDFDGLYATHTWARGEGELALDVYAGRIGTTARFSMRDGVPPLLPAGVQFVDITVRSAGAVLTLREPDALWRAGLHQTATRRRNGQALPVRFPFVPVAPGLGYYKVADELPGPPLETTPSVRNLVFTLGGEQQLGADWRVAAEFARNLQRDTELGSDSRGGYLALFRRIGHATPYLSVGALRSRTGLLDWYRRLTANPLPEAIPGAAQINAAQRAAAETNYAYDQRSLAVGSSFAFDPRQKLKLEWQHTHVGRVSVMVDTPAGRETPHDTSIDLWSVNYSFTF